MSVSIEKSEGDVRILTVTGLLAKKEFDELRAEAGKRLGFFDRVKLLVIADKFDGWEPGVDWGTDTSFFSWHGWKIYKIAIVADPQWKSKFLAFTVAGMRRAPVEFFPTGETEKARAWLEEDK
jgi:hypothetical protein